MKSFVIVLFVKPDCKYIGVLGIFSGVNRATTRVAPTDIAIPVITVGAILVVAPKELISTDIAISVIIVGAILVVAPKRMVTQKRMIGRMNRATTRVAPTGITKMVNCFVQNVGAILVVAPNGMVTQKRMIGRMNRVTTRVAPTVAPTVGPTGVYPKDIVIPVIAVGATLVVAPEEMVAPEENKYHKIEL